ncbi:phosphoenolpyruvate carboxykinase domain-containing protein [Streptomyces murinus]|uniref:phosphoenolpyruvate carboxykinase domain-containing protein n=1 Tax=Streptomyces murinus TaxID=33900 RepID=UPI003F451B34
MWSYGSGYGGNALLEEVFLALRIASVLGRDEGWLAEHRPLLKLTSPQGKTHYIAAAFPILFLRQDQPGHARADPARMESRDSRRRHRLDAIRCRRATVRGQPGKPDSSASHRNQRQDQPQRHRHHRRRTHLHQHRRHLRRRRPGGRHDDSAPADLIDWHRKDWTPEAGILPAHPNSRYRTPIEQCPSVAPEWDDPAAVPISASSAAAAPA